MRLIRPCPVCNQNNYQPLYNPKESPGKVVKCKQCSMVYIANVEDDHALISNGPVTHFVSDPQILISSNLSEVQDLWEMRYISDKELNSSALKRNAKYALAKIECYLDRKASKRRILDFGSGWGFFLAVAREQGWKTQGLEPLAACSVYARAKFKLDIVTDTLHADTFASESFDCITSFQVFEHLPKPQTTLKYLSYILKQGGILLLEVPNIDTWTVKILKSHHRHFTKDHINFFSYKTFHRLLDEYGFEVVEHYYATRYITIHYLFTTWLSKYLTQNMFKIINKVTPFIHSNRTIGINLRDIMTIIARKY